MMVHLAAPGLNEVPGPFQIRFILQAGRVASFHASAIYRESKHSIAAGLAYREKEEGLGKCQPATSQTLFRTYL
jgi:hypothetical protein